MEEVLIELKKINKIYPIYKSNKDRVKELLSFNKKKYHSDFYAIQDLNLKLKKGEIVGIIGRNGAGKSTLLKIITGIVEPTSGQKIVKGSIVALIELGIGFNPEYTGIENIYFYGTAQGKSKEEIDAKLPEVINFAEIGDFINQPVKNYSSGMFARLAFSVAMSIEPQILIVDETLAVGDIFFQNKCIEKMKELINKGSLILFVSHDLHAIKFFCNRIVYLENGRIKKEGKNINEIIDLYEKGKLEEKKILSNNSEVAEIIETKCMDSDFNTKKRFKVGENLKIYIKYRIKGNIKNIFLGFGFRNHNGVYISGLNTKLDGVKLSDNIGEYEVVLDYKNFNVYKGVYTAWSVLYNETGTVVLADHVIQNAFEIFDFEEKCEGIVNLEHKWEIMKENE